MSTIAKPNHPQQRAGQADEPHHQGGNCKRFQYETCEQLWLHLADFMAADKFASHPKTLGGLAPYEHIVKI